MPGCLQRLHRHADARALLVQPLRGGADVTAVLAACAHAGDAQEGEEVLVQTRVVGVEPGGKGGVERGSGGHGANARFRHYIYVSDELLLTLRTTGFVENDEGFGITQAFDLDRVMGPDYLLRFGNSVRLSEETDGMRWRSRLALYQAIDYRRAMRYELSVRGETDGTQPDLYGLRVTHRRSVLRDWLFVEYGGVLFWADGPLPSDRCDACLGASIGFEVLFGDAYDRVLRRNADAHHGSPTR